MSVHLPSFSPTATSTGVNPGSCRAPGRRPPPIVGIHVVGAACDCPDCTRTNGLSLAFERLGAYLDAEGEDLHGILSLLDLAGGQADLAALQGLDVAPNSETAALIEAALRLKRIIDDLAYLAHRVTGFGLAPAPRDLDARICWLGARTQDVLATIQRALG